MMMLWFLFYNCFKIKCNFKEKCYKFTGLKSIPANENFNYGSVAFQLQWQSYSQVSKILLPQDKPNVEHPIKSYYAFLTEKMSIENRSMNPVKLHHLSGGEQW